MAWTYGSRDVDGRLRETHAETCDRRSNAHR